MNEISMEEGARLLPGLARISVIGCSGGGKSTLSQVLARRLNATYLCMDRQFFWLPGWVLRPREEQRALIAEAVKGERWIMDGTNPSGFDIRLPRSQMVIWVRVPGRVCLWSVVWRWMKHRGRTRPEMTPGCPEKVDLDFLRYIWSFEARHAPLIIANIEAHGPQVPVLILKSRGEMRRLLDLVPASA